MATSDTKKFKTHTSNIECDLPNYYGLKVYTLIDAEVDCKKCLLKMKKERYRRFLLSKQLAKVGAVM